MVLEMQQMPNSLNFRFPVYEDKLLYPLGVVIIQQLFQQQASTRARQTISATDCAQYPFPQQGWSVRYGSQIGWRPKQILCPIGLLQRVRGESLAGATLESSSSDPNLFGTRDWFLGRQFFHRSGSGGRGRCGFRMIQAHYIIVYFISILVAPQIIRHQIPEVGDPCSKSLQESESQKTHQSITETQKCDCQQ